MHMKASCLCGSVQIYIGAYTGPYDLCHCNRCKKHTGSAFNPEIDTLVEGFEITAGKENIESYKAPIIESEPAYQIWFCKKCGSPLPNPEPTGEVVEIPAGIIDGDIPIKPDKIIFVEQGYPWLNVYSTIKSFTKEEFFKFRERYGRKRCAEK